MAEPTTISPSIIETLYEDALLLADEARAAFDFRDRFDGIDVETSNARVAMSCEALRTTTRMMHAIAWLLNQKAYFAGEITEFQLRQHGRLPPPQPMAEPQQRAMMAPYVVELVDRSVAFYARIQRLDRAWRDRFELRPAAIHRLRERLGHAFATG